MGQIADLTLNGDMCERCGCSLLGNTGCIPNLCVACADEEAEAEEDE